MKRLLVKGITIAVMVAALIVPPAIGLSTDIAYAHHTPTPFFQPPPGCTDDWNTLQSDVHSHAPGGEHSPGCDKHTGG